MMDTILQDLRYALRTLQKTPGFTAAIVLTLGVGIGANTAIFTVLYRAVLRTLPVTDAGRLVHVVNDRGPDGVNYNLSYAAFDALRTRATVFSGVAAQTGLALAIRLDDGADRVDGAAVSRGFFGVLGASLARGREFLPEEDVPGGPPVAVLGYSLWQRRFAGRDDVVGTAITLNGQPFTVVGVAAPRFEGITAAAPTELWVPLASIVRLGGWGDLLSNRRASWLDVFARLAPSTSIAQAQAAMAVLDARAVPAGERPAAEHTVLRDGSHGLMHRVAGVQRPLFFLLVVVALVLVLACANIANLLLARASARRREIAIRLALGAGRGRLIRQLLIESITLALLGGAAGLLVARWGTDLLLNYQLPGGGRLAIDAGLDGVVLAFTLALAVLTGIAFGLAPALRASRPDVVPVLKGEAPRWHERVLGLRGALVITQVAVSLVLIVGAGLFLRSIRNLRTVDVGFTPGNVLLAALDLEQSGYDRTRGIAFLEQLFSRLRSLPQVEQASAAEVITPSPWGSNWSGVRLEGYTPPQGEDVAFDVNRVGPGYFAAMGIALEEGRGFDERATSAAPLVAVVNRTFARRYYGGRSPLGQHILIGPDSALRAIEIIGVAHDGKYRDVREQGQANVYFPVLQRYAPSVTLILRTHGEPAGFAGALRREIRTLDPNLPVFDIRTLAEHVATATAQDRMIATLSSLFGSVALLLAALGLFGVIAYTVTQRTREIGVRIALGAQQADVVSMVMRGGGALMAAGLAIGLIAVLALGRFAADLLYGVAPFDIPTTVVAIIVLVLAAALASYLPARRAARVDPMVALRTE